MTNTEYLPPIDIIRTPAEIQTRLDSWVATQQECWAIISTRSGTCTQIMGQLAHTAHGWKLQDTSSWTSFSLGSVDAVGQSCIFLKS